MWWIVQNLAPYGARDAWVLVIPVLFIAWVTSFKWWFGRQIPGMALWTDVLNMITVDMFNDLPTWWWAHGWTIAMLPYIGKTWVTVLVWSITVLFFGPSLWLGHGVGF